MNTTNSGVGRGPPSHHHTLFARWGSATLVVAGAGASLIISAWEPLLIGIAAALLWHYLNAVQAAQRIGEDLKETSDALARCKDDIAFLKGPSKGAKPIGHDAASPSISSDDGGAEDQMSSGAEPTGSPAKSRRALEEHLARVKAQLARERDEHEALLLDIAEGRAEVVPRGWAGTPLQPYLIVRRDDDPPGPSRKT